MTDIQRAAIAYIERRDDRETARTKLRSLYDDGSHCHLVDDHGNGTPCYQADGPYELLELCPFCDRHQAAYQEYRAACDKVGGALRSLKSAVKPFKGQYSLEFDAKRTREKA